MRKSLLVLAAGGIAFYVVAVVSTLYVARRPVFETVVPKAGSSAMLLDEPAGAPLDPSAISTWTVIGSDDKIVGRLAGVTEGSDGRAKWILVETGGFLGFGSRLVRVTAGDFTIGAGGVRTSLSSRELEQLPELDRPHPPR